MNLTTSNGNYLVEGMQLKNRALVPEWLRSVVLWVFFHRTDTSTSIMLSGFTR